jgi:hypothetical protein
MTNSQPDKIFCCFCGNDNDPLLRLELATPSEDGFVILWAHEYCFNRLGDNSVKPNNPKDHGRIPKNARCVFCGESLPIWRKHPYCFDIGNDIPPNRFWINADCLRQRVDPLLQNRI